MSSVNLTIKRRRVKNGFREELRARIDSFAPYKKISARIVVPYSLRWWYWLEYGTAARGEAGHASGHTYPITPVHALELKFPDPHQTYGPNTDGFHRTSIVNHPGIRPRRFVRDARNDIRLDARAELRAFIRRGKIRANILFDHVVLGTERARIRIAESLAIAAPDNRDGNPDGWARLEGRFAADVFDAESKIEGSSK